MPEVAIKHAGIKDPESTKTPVRKPVPIGQYCCLIMGAQQGATNQSPPLAKISVEFQIMYAVNEDKSHDDTLKGRRVYQDYILEPDRSNGDLNETRRFELRQLLDATDCPFTENGFNTDHLVNKTVLIKVKHRPGKEIDPQTGEKRVFVGVSQVDTVAIISDEDLV